MMTYIEKNLPESKFDLNDTSFIIHYRRDSDDREYNLRTILQFIDDNFNFLEVHVVNDDSVVDPIIKELIIQYPRVTFHFFKNDGVYKRVVCFNKIADICKGKVLCFYDTDVMIKPKFLEASQNYITSNQYDHVYPYNGLFIDIQKSYEELYSNYKFDELEKFIEKRELYFNNGEMEIWHLASVGGCFMISKEAFNKIGQYNSNFVGWGSEDHYIYSRSSRENRIFRIMDDSAILWHIAHMRNDKGDHVHQNERLLYV